MSTNGLTSWAVDLKDIGAIYPFQGWEVLMVILGFAFWIGWHIVQTRQESAEIASDMAADRSGDETRAAIERYLLDRLPLLTFKRAPARMPAPFASRAIRGSCGSGRNRRQSRSLIVEPPRLAVRAPAYANRVATSLARGRAEASPRSARGRCLSSEVGWQRRGPPDSNKAGSSMSLREAPRS